MTVDPELVAILEQREIVSIARDDMEQRKTYHVALVWQQERQTLERLVEARWAGFRVITGDKK